MLCWRQRLLLPSLAFLLPTWMVSKRTHPLLFGEARMQFLDQFQSPGVLGVKLSVCHDDPPDVTLEIHCSASTICASSRWFLPKRIRSSIQARTAIGAA